VNSEVAVDALMNVDPGFTQLVETLFGDVVDSREAWAYLYGPNDVVKMSPDMSSVHVPGSMGKAKRGRFVKKTVAMDVRGISSPMAKSDRPMVTWDVEFSKVDEDKHEVFGWASVVEMDGKPVVDRQGDWITPDEIEKAAYKYVLDSRKGGHQHKREGDAAFHASNMIESIVFTPEKIAKMGLPEDFPVGWWVGYKVHDGETWNKVKSGEVTGFSIHGSGKRVQVGQA